MSVKPSEAIFDAVCKLIDESSSAAVCDRTGLRPSAVSRWVVERKNGRRASFNADSFDKLMQLDEVKSALVANLRRLPDEDMAAREGIGEKLSRVMSSTVGWRFASLMQALWEMDLLDSQLSALEGLVKARRASTVEKARADKLASRKAKTADSK